MSDLVFAAPEIVTLEVFGSSARFPVRRVYCVGRNYAAHAMEMGHDSDREPPFFFQKNASNLDGSGEFPYPPQSSNVQHEVEMAVMLKSGGTEIDVSQSLQHVFGYAISLDMTRRDLQAEQKKMRRPWEIGKAFERSAPVGPIHSVTDIGHPDSGKIELKVNGEVRQTGDLKQMIWRVPDMIAVLSNYFELAAGDVILSGTPAGVGPIVKGDAMVASIEGLGEFSVKVT